jgi:hypothetical protein
MRCVGTHRARGRFRASAFLVALAAPAGSVSGCSYNCEAINVPPEVFVTVPAGLAARVMSIQLCVDDRPCEAMYDGKSNKPPGPDMLIERWWLPTELHKGESTRIRVLVDSGAAPVELTGSFGASRRTFGGHCNPHLVVDLRYEPATSSLVEQPG